MCRPRCLLFIALLSAAPALLAVDKGYKKDDEAIIGSQSFLASHPDLRSRKLGMESYLDGDHIEALRQFRKGAYYADKPSQAMVADMLWNGQGAAQDRAEAYVWMDMAAERLYKDFIAKREQYWAQLDATQRAQALAKGPGLYAKYGDAAAKPRIERILERDRRNITGSRTGYVSANLKIQLPGPNGYIDIDANQFYQEKFWQPEQYWQWQSVTWKALPTGTVTTSGLKAVAPAPTDDNDDNDDEP